MYSYDKYINNTKIFVRFLFIIIIHLNHFHKKIKDN